MPFTLILVDEAYLKCDVHGELVDPPALDRSSRLFIVAANIQGIDDGSRARAMLVHTDGTPVNGSDIVDAISVITEAGRGATHPMDVLCECGHKRGDHVVGDAECGHDCHCRRFYLSTGVVAP